MKTSITYSELINKLVDLGFTKKTVGSHVLLSYKEYDSTIVMPSFKGKIIAQTYFLQAVRKNLVEKGVLTADQFDTMLEY
ncbi:hypothetical protein [Spirosoma sp.]|uniref:hypothetical protein n=1 Tax=Spirosoma sp. TaxID=1899569 RepID=UPI00262F509A|nr:hypothetical protein [Spirosoma sp.]MCX6214566.1 hypothetical protein [Spirosoma sp.]